MLSWCNAVLGSTVSLGTFPFPKVSVVPRLTCTNKTDIIQIWMLIHLQGIFQVGYEVGFFNTYVDFHSKL